jgi:hypothetical protein
MERVGYLIVAMLIVGGCASTNAGEAGGTTASDTAEPEDRSLEARPDDGSGEDPPRPAATEVEGPIDITGLWENASCGERKYRRKITFLERDSKFVAVDEVAPCPPGATCVWSGIINWHGSWTIEGRTVRLKAKPLKSSKMPERLPEAFTILGTDPVSIGEQSNGVICPYQKTR